MSNLLKSNWAIIVVVVSGAVTAGGLINQLKNVGTELDNIKKEEIILKEHVDKEIKSLETRLDKKIKIINELEEEVHELEIEMIKHNCGDGK